MTTTNSGASAEPPLKPTFSAKVFVKLAGSAILLAVVFWVVGFESVTEALANTRPGPWLLGLLGFLGLHLLSAAKWRFFLATVGADISLSLAIKCYAAGLFANLCLPSLVGGDVLRAGLAMQGHPNKAAIAFGSVVDRLSDVMALGLLVAAGMVVAPSAAEKLHGGWISGPAVFAVLLAGAVIGLLFARWLLARLPWRKLPRKLTKVLIKLLRALNALLRHPARSLIGLTFCLGLQTGFVVVNIHLGQMVGLDLDARLWFLLWPLAKVAAMIPVSLGGLGVREAAFAALVQPFADGRLAVAESLVWQSILIVGGLISGGFWMLSGLRARPSPEPT